MIGVLGKAVFMSSSFRTFTIRDMTRAAEPRIEEHKVIGQKPKLEFISPGLEELSFNIRLDVSFGVIPEMELMMLRKSRDKGEILPLILGGKFVGNFIITGLQESHKVQDRFGVTRIAEANIAIKEVREEWPIMT